MAGLQRAGIDPGIVWLDAHGDVQTLESTASGYLGGLPLRLLVGYRPELIAARPGLRYPAPRGPGAAAVTGALRMVLATGRVAAVGIACTWHPGHRAAAGVGPQLAAALPIGS